MSHSVVIIEDEPPARAKLARFLAEYEDFRVAAEADTVESGIEAIRSASPDVVYLDIQLGTQSGFDVLDGVRGVASPLIVFTTAYSQHAVRALRSAGAGLSAEAVRSGSLSEQHRAGARRAQGARSQRSRRAHASAAGGDAGAAGAGEADSGAGGERAFFHLRGRHSTGFGGGKLRRGPRGRESAPRARNRCRISSHSSIRRSSCACIGPTWCAWDSSRSCRPMFHGDYELVLKDGQRLNLSRRLQAVAAGGDPRTVMTRPAGCTGFARGIVLEISRSSGEAT